MRLVVVGVGDKGGHGVAGLRRTLEVDVVDEGVDEILDDGLGQSLLERRLVETLVKAQAPFRGVRRRAARGVALRAGHIYIFAVVLDRDGGAQLVVAVDVDAGDAAAEIGVLGVGILQDHLLPVGYRRPAALGSERRQNGGGDRGRRPVIAQDLVERRAVLGPDQPLRGGAHSSLLRARHAGHVLRNHAHRQRRKRYAGRQIAGRRVGERAERIDAGARGAHQQQLGRHREAALARLLIADEFLDLRHRLGQRQLAGHRGDVRGSYVMAGEGDLGVVLRGRNVGLRFVFAEAIGGGFQRIEGGDRGGELGRRRGQGRRQQRVGPGLDDLLFADPDRLRDVIVLFGRHDIDGADEAISLAALTRSPPASPGCVADTNSGRAAKDDWRSRSR